MNWINCDLTNCELTFIASVWVHFSASFDKVLSSNTNDISWTNCFETEAFYFWNKKSPSKIFTFSNIQLRIIFVTFDMIMDSSVIEFLEALNNALPFSPSGESTDSIMSWDISSAHVQSRCILISDGNFSPLNVPLFLLVSKTLLFQTKTVT